MASSHGAEMSSDLLRDPRVGIPLLGDFDRDRRGASGLAGVLRVLITVTQGVEVKIAMGILLLPKEACGAAVLLVVAAWCDLLSVVRTEESGAAGKADGVVPEKVFKGVVLWPSMVNL